MEGSSMAKALIGYMNSDLRTPARLTAENTRLRTRVGELEALVLRLSQENDALAAAAQADALLELRPETMQEMQPV
jgi:cell division protein FtsB